MRSSCVLDSVLTERDPAREARFVVDVLDCSSFGDAQLSDSVRPRSLCRQFGGYGFVVNDVEALLEVFGGHVNKVSMIDRYAVVLG